MWKNSERLWNLTKNSAKRCTSGAKNNETTRGQWSIHLSNMGLFSCRGWSAAGLNANNSNKGFLSVHSAVRLTSQSLLGRRANARNASQHTLRCSAYPHQPLYVDTLYVLPPRRRRPKPVLMGGRVCDLLDQRLNKRGKLGKRFGKKRTCVIRISCWRKECVTTTVVEV